MDKYVVIPSYVFVRRSWCVARSKVESYNCALMLRSRLVALATGAQTWGACQALESTDTRTVLLWSEDKTQTNLQVEHARSDHDVCLLAGR
jgi:hypothetical protein